MLRKTFPILCPQGHTLTVSTFHIGLQVPCPTCQTLVVVPSLEEAAAHGKPVPRVAASSRVPIVSLADAGDEEGFRHTAEERSALARVRLGLSFFLADIIVTALSMTAFFVAAMAIGVQLGAEMEQERIAKVHQEGKIQAVGPDGRLVLRDNARLQPQNDPEFQKKLAESTEKLQAGIAIGGPIMIFVTHTLWIVGALFCLSVPPSSRARGLLMASTACFVTRAIILYLLSTQQMVQFIQIYVWLLLLVTAMSPVLYNMFLSRLSAYLHRRDLVVQSLLMTIGWYLLIGGFVAIAVAGETAKGNNEPGMQMLVGLLALGLVFAAGIWFVFYVILLARLRGAITREIN